MSMAKATLLYALRDDVLHLLCERCQKPHEGIAQAARDCKARGFIRSELCNKLIKFDYAYNMVRHLTSLHAAEFFRAVQDEISQSAPIASPIPISEILREPPLLNQVPSDLGDVPAPLHFDLRSINDSCEIYDIMDSVPIACQTDYQGVDVQPPLVCDAATQVSPEVHDVATHVCAPPSESDVYELQHWEELSDSGVVYIQRSFPGLCGSPGADIVEDGGRQNRHVSFDPALIASKDCKHTATLLANFKTAHGRLEQLRCQYLGALDDDQDIMAISSSSGTVPDLPSDSIAEDIAVVAGDEWGVRLCHALNIESLTGYESD